MRKAAICPPRDGLGRTEEGGGDGTTGGDPGGEDRLDVGFVDVAVVVGEGSAGCQGCGCEQQQGQEQIGAPNLFDLARISSSSSCGMIGGELLDLDGS